MRILCNESDISFYVELNQKLHNQIVHPTFFLYAEKPLLASFEKIAKMKKPAIVALPSGMVPVHYNSDYCIIPSMLNVGYNFQNISICWKSKSGKIYKLEDEFDPDDVEFWLQDLDLDLLYRNLYGPSKLPFKLKLSFQLETGAIDMDLEMRLFPLDFSNSVQAIENEFDAIVNDLNSKSSKSENSDGIIHNWHTQQMSDHLFVKLDMGSADFNFLKKILQRLSKTNHYSKVIVGRIENIDAGM